MTPVVIALGSNLGDRALHLAEAVKRLSEPVVLTAVSSVVESAPMYVTDQPAFLNQVVRGETSLGPCQLLAALKMIEVSLGREPGERNGPRVIDLDIVVFGVLQLRSNVVTIPHPRAAERPFVMGPWRSIDAPGADRLLAPW
ncbi:MAG: 2-amino-4-hydroxy-6-hydroxymethyldihydropteridine diphosphokinase [Fimbriimonadaceae bacterium]|nr:2-amino-4-hydroxy-6-hydroxymethyldihydropteridine diphosphokinase [Fimbriimonadaceae bacterium]